MPNALAAPYAGDALTAEDLLGPLAAHERLHVPPRLYHCGDRGLLDRSRTRVSIVGSRRASGRGLRRASQLARDLVRSDIVVVSGLAAGIDTAAHKAALRHRGKTIAVLGTPLDQCSPVSNRDLQNRIGREHLLLSQLAPGEPGGKWAFPARNRLMALISDATVIIEAGETSGTRHQAWEAVRLNTPLLIAQSLLGRGLDWTDKLMEYGARPLTRTQDVLDVVAIGGSMDPLPFKGEFRRTPGSEFEAQLWPAPRRSLWLEVDSTERTPFRLLAAPGTTARLAGE